MNKYKEVQFDQIKYQQEYNKNHYDSVNIMIPKGMREKIKTYAKADGLSVAKYILKTIEFYENNKEN